MIARVPVAVSCRAAAGRPWRARTRARAERVLAALGLDGHELSLSIVGDEEMRALNRAYRGVDRPTDVLAFPLHEQACRARARRGGASRRRPAAGRDRRPVGAELLLGDVVLSIETAAAQARSLACGLAERLDELLIHGVLHLAGYDHEVSAAEARRMARRAREVRAALAAPGAAPRSARAKETARRTSAGSVRARKPRARRRLTRGRG